MAEAKEKVWRFAKREFEFSKGPLVMAVLNATPDSFSDGGKFASPGQAVDQALRFIKEGADIVDIGGESTRPGGARVDESVEIERVVPVIEQIRLVSDIPISIDTTKAAVARAALDVGADIVNDVSGLRFDTEMKGVVADSDCGLVIMHLRGEFESMHRNIAGESIFKEVIEGLRWSLREAELVGIGTDRLCVDVGIGFSKTHAQNLDLLAGLRQVADEFVGIPLLIGVSRKSFIGKITGEQDPAKRLGGTIAANCAAVYGGADILRVHDVRETVDAVKVLSAIWSSV